MDDLTPEEASALTIMCNKLLREEITRRGDFPWSVQVSLTEKCLISADGTRLSLSRHAISEIADVVECGLMALTPEWKQWANSMEV